MCGGWPVEVGAGEASLWHSWRPGPGPGPGHITTILLQPLQSAAAPQMGHRPHTAPSPQSSWHSGHQTSDDSFTRPRARPVSGCPGPSGVRSEAWWDYTAVSHSRELGLGLVQTTETGLGLNTTLPLTLVTTQENTVTAVTSKQKMKGFVGFSKNRFWLWVKCHEWAER